MKLKYYVRGLGIGIVFATLLCVISFKVSGQNNISDAEIVRRAEALGMVMRSDIIKEEETSAETDTSNDSKESESTSEANANETKASETETTAIETETATENVTEASTASTENTEPVTVATQPATEPVTEVGKTVVENVSVDVISGMDSASVSKLLYAAGIVDDATEFDRYLVNNNYANNIRTGNYIIPKGSSYDAIAKILTGR